MSKPAVNIDTFTHTGRRITPQEAMFIAAYMVHKNGSEAVREAGYKTKRPEGQARALLEREHIREEINWRLQQIEDRKIADSTEVLRFYTSVMRGEVLDQFGIECSVDTRIKAANELAKHLIELPMKLEQKNNANAVGSITLNFIPRKDEIEEETSSVVQDAQYSELP